VIHPRPLPLSRSNAIVGTSAFNRKIPFTSLYFTFSFSFEAFFSLLSGKQKFLEFFVNFSPGGKGKVVRNIKFFSRWRREKCSGKVLQDCFPFNCACLNYFPSFTLLNRRNFYSLVEKLCLWGSTILLYCKFELMHFLLHLFLTLKPTRRKMIFKSSTFYVYLRDSCFPEHPAFL